MNVHILNGDALKEQLDKSLSGNIIVARECMIEGSTSGSSLEELFQNRAEFLKTTYGTPIEEYREKSVSEFRKLSGLGPAATVNLWFEDDLFCQTNLWFCCHLIKQYTRIGEVYLVRAVGELQFGFGGMSVGSLLEAYEQKSFYRI